jgi:hypothetical protein
MKFTQNNLLLYGSSIAQKTCVSSWKSMLYLASLKHPKGEPMATLVKDQRKVDRPNRTKKTKSAYILTNPMPRAAAFDKYFKNMAE